MAEKLASEQKVYSEFFTNLAVAWITVGIITPFFAKPKAIEETFFFSIFGILGAFASLRADVIMSKGGKK